MLVILQFSCDEPSIWMYTPWEWVVVQLSTTELVRGMFCAQQSCDSYLRVANFLRLHFPHWQDSCSVHMVNESCRFTLVGGNSLLDAQSIIISSRDVLRWRSIRLPLATEVMRHVVVAMLSSNLVCNYLFETWNVVK